MPDEREDRRCDAQRDRLSLGLSAITHSGLYFPGPRILLLLLLLQLLLQLL
jgi:hypothetical protein